MNLNKLERETDSLYKSLLPWLETTSYWPPIEDIRHFPWLLCWLEMAGNLNIEFRETFNRLPLSEFTNKRDGNIFNNLSYQYFNVHEPLFKVDIEPLYWANDWQSLHNYCVDFSKSFPHRRISSYAIRHELAFQNQGGGWDSNSYSKHLILPSWSKHLPTDFNRLMLLTNEHAYFMDFA